MSEIRLEVGKTYEVRSPNNVSPEPTRVKILCEQEDGCFDFLGDDGFTYRADGTFSEKPGQSDYDLIKEVTP